MVIHVRETFKIPIGVEIPFTYRGLWQDSGAYDHIDPCLPFMHYSMPFFLILALFMTLKASSFLNS